LSISQLVTAMRHPPPWGRPGGVIDAMSRVVGPEGPAAAWETTAGPDQDQPAYCATIFVKS
jgi:hypothetical protein